MKATLSLTGFKGGHFVLYQSIGICWRVDAGTVFREEDTQAQTQLDSRFYSSGFRHP